MPHICMDEIIMFMAALPVVGFYLTKVHTWYHSKFNHKDHN